MVSTPHLQSKIMDKLKVINWFRSTRNRGRYTVACGYVDFHISDNDKLYLDGIEILQITEVINQSRESKIKAILLEVEKVNSSNLEMFQLVGKELEVCH